MKRTARPKVRALRKRQAGLALIFAVFALAGLALAVASGLLVGSSDIRATRNYRGSQQVHFVAESGISDALQTVNAIGVVNFQNEVVNGWAGMYGTSAKNFGALSGFTYTVTSVASALTPADSGRLIATANGPEGVRNVVVANVSRSNIPSRAPGAVYLATDAPTNSDFRGDNFRIDGNDHCWTCPGGLALPNNPVPGLSTRNDSNTQQAVGDLSTGGGVQMDNITGLGYLPGPPPVPSVMTSPWAPTVAQMNSIIDDILAKPGVVNYSDPNINGNACFGGTGTGLGCDASLPQITHFTGTGGVTIRGNGNASGAGIMIVEGDLTIMGTLDFKGLILVRGRTNVQNDPSLTDVLGTATVYGSLWTQDVNLIVGGSAVINYSTQALALADQVNLNTPVPAPLIVSSLADCSMIPSGVGGCP